MTNDLHAVSPLLITVLCKYSSRSNVHFNFDVNRSTVQPTPRYQTRCETRGHGNILLTARCGAADLGLHRDAAVNHAKNNSVCQPSTHVLSAHHEHVFPSDHDSSARRQRTTSDRCGSVLKATSTRVQACCTVL